MSYYFKELIDKLNRDNRLSKYEGRSYEDRKKVYIDGKEYEEKNLTIAYAIDTGEIFYHTVAISVAYIPEIDLCRVVVHYIDTQKIFHSLDYNVITETIIEAINNEITNNNANNEKIAV